VLEGVSICKEHNIEAVVPIGGGSCFDTAKAVAFGAMLPLGV